jgi:hypothetical protein
MSMRHDSRRTRAWRRPGRRAGLCQGGWREREIKRVLSVHWKEKEREERGRKKLTGQNPSPAR